MTYRENPAFRIHEALGGLTFRLSDLVSQAGRVASDPTYDLIAGRAFDSLRAAQGLLVELEAALTDARAKAREEAA